MREITAEQLHLKLKEHQQVVLLDVRQQWEHDTATLPNSVLIPLNELPGRTEEIEVPAGAELVVYCHHGVRSRSAALILEQLGFRDVISLAGGIDAWSLRVDPQLRRY